MLHLFDIPSLIATFGYVGILVIVFLESGIFFLLPGDSMLFTIGLLAPELGWNIPVFLLAVITAAFLGSHVGYHIGIKLEYFYRYAFFRKFVKKEHLDETFTFLENHGFSALVFGRFMPIIRTFLPIVAGMVRMRYSNFIYYNLISAVIWCVLFTLSGYFLGQSFPQIGDYLFFVILGIVIISILPGVIRFLRRRK